jgi:hypothetical protein
METLKKIIEFIEGNTFLIPFLATYSFFITVFYIQKYIHLRITRKYLELYKTIKHRTHTIKRRLK